MRTIDLHDLDDLACGAAVLGTGGGGDPYIGKLLAAAAIRAHGPVRVVSADEVPGSALVVPIAVMGAPTVMVEKLPAGSEAKAVLAALSRTLGERPTHLACIEAGGLNSMIPIAAAAEAGLPLIDADGMGRAFPELQMVLTTLAGIPTTPMALADERGNHAVLSTIDNKRAETFARGLTVDMGGWAFAALYPMRGRQLADAMVPHTLSLAREIGRTVREARLAHLDPVNAVIEVLGGRALFTGKVVDVERRTDGGFVRGTARLEGLGVDRGASLRLRFQNEHLLAERDGAVLATVPDLLCVLDTDSGEPITTEAMRYGFRVTLIGAPCDPRWRTPAGLNLVGPRAFGYDLDFTPVNPEAAELIRS